MKLLLVGFLIIFSYINNFTQSTIKGYVKDNDNGQSLELVEVILLDIKIKTYTDNNGFFSINNVSNGKYKIIIKSVGYEVFEENIELNDDTYSKVYNLSKSKLLDEVIISAKTQDRTKSIGISLDKVSSKGIEKIPTMGAEADLTSYIQTLPSVVTTGDKGGQIYIRGGTPVQNLVLLDGITIYNPFHSIGFYSVFETELIKSAKVYTGGFDAEFSNRISSVMDVSYQNGNTKKASGILSVSPFMIRAMINGPLVKAKDNNSSLTYVLSYKKSIINNLAPTIYPYIKDFSNTDTDLPFEFSDLFAKLNYGSGSGNNFSVFGFNFNDKVSINETTNYKWSNIGIGSKLIVAPKYANFLMEGIMAFSAYKTNLNEVSILNRNGKISNYKLGFDFKYFMTNNYVKYGLAIEGVNTQYKSVNIYNATTQQEKNSIEVSAYTSYFYNKELGKNRHLLLMPSVRLQYYPNLKNLSLEPRFSAKYSISSDFRLKLATGLYSQNLISVSSDRDVVNLFYGYVIGPDNLQKTLNNQNGETSEVKHKLQKATHFIFGTEYDINDNLTFDIEAYYKLFNQLTNENRNKIYADNVENTNISNYLKKDYIIETGKSYGVDFVLKYKKNNFEANANYTLAYTDRWDGLITYSPIYDRRHTVNFLLSYSFGKNDSWKTNARFNYGSELPFTLNQGFYNNLTFPQGGLTDITSQNSDELTLILDDINRGRMIPYHRIDIGVSKEIKFSNSLLTLNFGVTNIYNRKNIFYINRFNNDRVNQMPILPSMSVKYSF